MEKPYENFFPEQETPIFPLKKVSLTRVNTNTPFLISPNIAERTHIFHQKHSLKNETTPKPNYQIDWSKEYEDASLIFVPENRWAHEVTRKPEFVEKNKYKIYLDADVKMQPSEKGLELITRTLLPYVEINKNPSKDFLDFYDLNKNDYIPYFYSWIIRWTPKNNCKLVFYSDQEIESNMLIKVPKIIIDYNSSEPHVKVPFLISKNLFPKKTIILHDSAIMYLEIINEG